MKFSPPPLTVGLDVASDADVVWNLLTRVDEWPRWGPSVSRASIDGGGERIGPGATGTVWTAPGPAVPFRIEAWQGTGAVRRWSWRVAGVPATGHTVRTRDGGCRVEMTAPWWAPGYVPVLWVALRRIKALAQDPRPASTR